ncbi:uncharacterized protein LOC133722853 [Rosa rugosa]|uniref:uncharacterized protein LOC133722853 n=1 Tax=Rosa rugosa TaxID=74645 RepID=UPI002B40DAD6|nr:uncharacterized protein LOC133722853 [Rosa rugosa]
MDALCNHELDLILNWVKGSDDRKSFSQVSKRLWAVERLNRSSIRLLELIRLPRLLDRFPNLVTFQTSLPLSNADLELLAQRCPKLEVIDLGIPALSFRKVAGTQGLCTLANRCPKLSKVLLRGRHMMSDGIVSFIPLADNLKHLDLGYIVLVFDKTLEAIGSSSCPITVLNLESCCHITDCGLRFLTNGSCSKTIKELVLANCHGITDSGVSLLQKMCALEELNLAHCHQVTDVGGVAISAIRTLKKLDFARGPRVTDWGPRVTDRTILALAENCLNLEMLDLSGNKFVTRVGIRAFLGHKCLQSLDLRYIRVYVSGSDLEDLALACPSLKSILVEGGWRKRLMGEMQESTVSRFVRFN